MLLYVGSQYLGWASPSMWSLIARIDDLQRLEALIDRLDQAQSWDDLLQAELPR